MKTINLLIIATILFTINANSQITKGFWMVGGDVGFSFSKIETKNSSSASIIVQSEDVGNYTISVEPNIGYFFMDKFALGINVNYINGFTEGSKFDFKGGNLGLGPYARYYFLKQQKQVNLFIETSYSYFTSKYLDNSSSVGIKAGTVVFLNESVGFETTLGYTKSNGEQNKSKNILLGFGLQIHLEK